MALCRYLKMAIFKHYIVILNNKSPFVSLMKTVEVLFLVRVCSFQHSLLATNRLHFKVLSFNISYEINVIINIILILFFIYKVWLSAFLNSKALVFFLYQF